MTHFSRRHFLTTAAAAASSALLPRVSLATPQDPVVDAKGAKKKDGTPFNGKKVAWKVRPFPMKQVRLGDGPCKIAMEADRQYLHSLPPDRLLHTFRINAGISSTAQPLGGWEAPNCELRGHYAGGHYLSACALMYASTGDEELKRNATTVVTELGKCQAELKNGYLSAFPIDFFDRLRERERVWAPFYTIHKIMAGLLDMYVYCDNEQALDMVQKMAGWVAGYTGSLSYEHMQRVLGTEYGGMGEVLSNLYAVTGSINQQHIGLMFGMVITPMIFFGCTYYPWSALTTFPILQKIVLVNPLVYASEGLRAALVPQFPHLSTIAILIALLFFDVLLLVVGLRRFEKKAVS